MAAIRSPPAYQRAARTAALSMALCILPFLPMTATAQIKATLHFATSENNQHTLIAGRPLAIDSMFAPDLGAVEFESQETIQAISYRRHYGVTVSEDGPWDEIAVKPLMSPWQEVPVGGRIPFDYLAQDELPRPSLSQFRDLKTALLSFIHGTHNDVLRVAASRCAQSGSACSVGLTGVEYQVRTRTAGNQRKEYRLMIPFGAGC